MGKLNLFPIVVVILFSLLVLGAEQQGCNKTTNLSNSTALQMSFVDNAPKSQLSPTSKVPIYIKVQNLGSYDIAPGAAKFYLSGVGNNLKNLNLIASNQNMLGKKTSIQEGGFEIIHFAEQAEPGIQVSNPYDFTIKFSSCYTYMTSTQATICIGPSSGTGNCAVSGEKIGPGSNTNAPIQITSLTEQVQGNMLFISFMIENKGTGNVYYTNLDCDKLFGQNPNERVQEELKKNLVSISVQVEGEPDITCILQDPNGGSINAKQGVASIGYKVTCTKTLTGQDVYPAPITINLAYKYSESLSKKITLLPY